MANIEMKTLTIDGETFEIVDGVARADVGVLSDRVDGLSAADNKYDNTSSGLNATNVQGAIDEVHANANDAIEAIFTEHNELDETVTNLSNEFGELKLNTLPAMKTEMLANDAVFTNEITTLYGDISDLEAKVDTNKTATDNSIANLQTAVNARLPLAGGNMTGSISMMSNNAKLAFSTSWGSARLGTANDTRDLYMFATDSTGSTIQYMLLANESGINIVPKSGGNFTGNLGTLGTFACSGTASIGNQLKVNSGKIQSTATYNSTTSTASNVTISSDSWFNRSTASSRRYKHDIEDLQGELNSEKLLEVPVRQYKFNEDYLSKEDQRYMKDVPGFIAEELHEHYPIAVELNDGVIEDWNHRMIIPPMLDLIQKLYKKVEVLEAEIAQLKAK